MNWKWLIISLLVVVVLFTALGFLPGPNFIDDITEDLPKAGSYRSRSLAQIKYIIIHHSASSGQSPYDYASFHISKGWPGIGYHFVIDPSGKTWQTNALETVSYHVANNNTACLGICLSGDLDQRPMTKAQKRSLKTLIQRLKRKLPGSLQVRGHRDFVDTGCPGSFTDITEFQ